MTHQAYGILPRVVAVFLLVLLNTGGHATQSLTLELDSGAEIPVTRYGGAGDRLLWIPSEYGLEPDRHARMGEALAGFGMEVWLADLHSGYFTPPGRRSLNGVPTGDIASLIQRSLPRDGRRLFLLSAEKGATLTLMALRRWQHDQPANPQLAGVLLLHPNLLAATPVPGDPAEYHPIVDHTRIPLYLIQPASSTKRWYLEGLAERLRTAGSPVFMQLISEVADGYYSRPEATDMERRKSAALPGTIRDATRLLAATRHMPATIPVTRNPELDEWSIGPVAGSLQPYAGTPLAPRLSLGDLEDASYRLRDYRGRVVLLNFWATWCPPCVAEIPTLGRLKNTLAGTDFTLLSIDVGESRRQVREFLARVPAAYPVLLDTAGTTIGPWKLQAFPTTFIIDRQGHIRLGYFGALDWDSPEIVRQIRALQDEGK